MKKLSLLVVGLFILFLSACSIKPEAKVGNSNIKQNNNKASSEEKTNLATTTSEIATTTNLKITYLEDLKPGYSYGLEGITVKSVNIQLPPEGKFDDWGFSLALAGELNAEGKYYVYGPADWYCLELDNPNLLPQLGSKRLGFMAKSFHQEVYSNHSFCFTDENSDSLAIKIFGQKYNGDKSNAGLATVKVKDITINLTTGGESYNSAILVEAVKK